MNSRIATTLRQEIGSELGLDPGYLSRIVQSFDEKGLITRKPLPADRRQYQLCLTQGPPDLRQAEPGLAK